MSSKLSHIQWFDFRIMILLPTWCDPLRWCSGFVASSKCLCIHRHRRLCSSVMLYILLNDKSCWNCCCYIWRPTGYNIWWFSSHMYSTPLKYEINKERKKKSSSMTRCFIDIMSTNTQHCVFECSTCLYAGELVRQLSVLFLEAQWVILKKTYSILYYCKSSIPEFLTPFQSAALFWSSII